MLVLLLVACSRGVGPRLKPLDACDRERVDVPVPSDLPDVLVAVLPIASEVLGDDVVITLNTPVSAASWSGSGCDDDATVAVFTTTRGWRVLGCGAHERGRVRYIELSLYKVVIRCT